MIIRHQRIGIINPDTGVPVSVEAENEQAMNEPVVVSGGKKYGQKIEIRNQTQGEDYSNAFHDSLGIFESIGAPKELLEKVTNVGFGALGLSAAKPVCKAIVAGIGFLVSLFEPKRNGWIKAYMPLITRCQSEIILRDGTSMKKEGIMFRLGYYKAHNVGSNAKKCEKWKKDMASDPLATPWTQPTISNWPAFVLFPEFDFYQPFNTDYETKGNEKATATFYDYVLGNGLDYFIRFLLGLSLKTKDNRYGNHVFGTDKEWKTAFLVDWHVKKPDKKATTEKWIKTLATYRSDFNKAFTFEDNESIHAFLTQPVQSWDWKTKGKYPKDFQSLGSTCDPRRSIIGYLTNWKPGVNDQIWPDTEGPLQLGSYFSSVFGFPNMWRWNRDEGTATIQSNPKVNLTWGKDIQGEITQIIESIVDEVKDEQKKEEELNNNGLTTIPDINQGTNPILVGLAIGLAAYALGRKSK